MEGWGPIVSFMLAVIACLLGVIVRQNSKLSDKLELKVNEETCGERHGRVIKEQEGLWGAINNHSHTTLPNEARVIR